LLLTVTKYSDANVATKLSSADAAGKMAIVNTLGRDLSSPVVKVMRADQVTLLVVLHRGHTKHVACGYTIKADTLAAMLNSSTRDPLLSLNTTFR
jgi:hypothetical protein